MTLTTDLTRYTAVLQAHQRFIAVEIQGNEITGRISEGTDQKIVQAAAECFARAQSIPFHLDLLNPPVYSVINTVSGWFPAKLGLDKIEVIEAITGDSRSISMNGSKQTAEKWARLMAKSYNLFYLPLPI